MRTNFALWTSALALVAACDTVTPTPTSPPAKWQVIFHDNDLKGAILSVWGTTKDDVWLVGAKDPVKPDNKPTALRWDGSKWNKIEVNAPGADLWWVAGLPGGDVWMAGTQGTIARWSRASGTVEVQSTPEKQILFGILPVTATEIWAVGGNPACAGAACGVIWKSDGKTWAPATIPAELLAKSKQWFKVSKYKDDILVVGSWSDDATPGVILKYDGKTWSSIASGINRTLLTVHGDGSRSDVPNCFAVGGSNSGDISELQADGSWKKYIAGATLPMLNGVRVPTKGNPVAVGSGGAVYERKNGKWVAREDLPDVFDDFHSVWIDPDGAIWAAGGQILSDPQVSGLVLRYGVGKIATQIN